MLEIRNKISKALSDVLVDVLQRLRPGVALLGYLSHRFALESVISL
jgi:hypothetical protein